MSTWQHPCPYTDGAHDFEPYQRKEARWYIGNRLIVAICRKCGAAR